MNSLTATAGAAAGAHRERLYRILRAAAAGDRQGEEPPRRHRACAPRDVLGRREGKGPAAEEEGLAQIGWLVICH